MQNYPVVSFSKEIETVVLPIGTTLTIWLTQKKFTHDQEFEAGKSQQIELRVLPNGKYQIFLETDHPIEILDFSEWNDTEKDSKQGKVTGKTHLLRG